MSKGFTLVELVITIILIGILSVSASALFFNPSALSALAVRDQLLSALNQAQLKALSTGQPVQLVLSQSASDWTLVLTAAPGTPQALEVQRQVYERQQATVAINGSALSNGANWSQTFTNQGAIANQQRLVFTSSNSHALCLASSGYAYSGNCQP